MCYYALKLIEILAKIKIPITLIKLIEITIRDSTAKVWILNYFLETLDISTGVRQGDVLSFFLFNLIIKSVITKLDISCSIINKITQILVFADDIVMLSKERKALATITKKLTKEAGLTGLFLNRKRNIWKEVNLPVTAVTLY